METTDTIWITRPTKELVAFIEKAHTLKDERIRKMRERFLQNQTSTH